MKRIGQEGKVLKQACLRAWLSGWLSKRLADLGLFVIAGEQYLFKAHFIADVAVELLDTEHASLLN